MKEPLGRLVVAIPLDRARLCADCEAVTNMEWDDCPTCGGEQFIVLSKVLGTTKKMKDRSEETETA